MGAAVTCGPRVRGRSQELGGPGFGHVSRTWQDRFTTASFNTWQCVHQHRLPPGPNATTYTSFLCMCAPAHPYLTHPTSSPTPHGPQARAAQSARDHEVDLLRLQSRAGALEASLEGSKLREGSL